jgi:hypothetical protein
MNRQLTATAAAQAAAVLTTTSTFSAGETVTIGPIIYTIVSALAHAYDVLIGAAGSASITLDNLKAAINGAAGAGTLYGTGTAAHPQVAATTKTSAALTLQALIPSSAGNAIATTATTANATFAAGTMAGGVDAAYALTQTGAAAGASVAIDDLNPGPYLIRLTVTKLTPTDPAHPSTARFSFPDSVNAFGASLPGPALSFSGPIVAAGPVTKSVANPDYAGLRLGTGSAVMRCNLDEVVNVASITYTAQLEQPQ